MHQSPAAPFAFPALIAANLILACGPWLVRLCQEVAGIGPVAAGFWRLSLAIPFLAFVAWRQQAGRPLPGWGMIAIIVGGGIFFAADLGAWHAGILMTKMANATLFGNFASFLFTIYGFLMLRSLPEKAQLAAFALAAIGTLLLLGNSYELSAEHFTGDLLALFAGVCYAVYLVAVDRARRDMKPWPVLAIATTGGALPLLLFALAIGEQVLPGNWAPVIALSVSSQLIGQGLLVYAIGNLSPVVVGLAFLTQPITAAAIGWMVFGEKLSWGEGVGALLICAALVLIRLPARGARRMEGA